MPLLFSLASTAAEIVSGLCCYTRFLGVAGRLRENSLPLRRALSDVCSNKYQVVLIDDNIGAVTWMCVWCREMQNTVASDFMFFIFLLRCTLEVRLLADPRSCSEEVCDVVSLRMYVLVLFPEHCIVFLSFVKLCAVCVGYRAF